MNALLTDLHPEAPAGINALIDLPVGIRERNFTGKLEALQEVYEDDVMRGLGLMMIVLQNADQRWHWRLREATELWLRQLDDQEDFEALVLRHLSDYINREKQLVWALRDLEIPAEMGLDYLRCQGSQAYDFGGCGPGLLNPDHPTWPELVPDPVFEQELIERHGPCPEWFDPSHGGEVEPAGLNIAARIELLGSVYRPALERATALEELLARVDTVRSRLLIDELREQGNDSREIFRQELSEVIALEGQCCWTAAYLGLKPGEAIRQIIEQL